MVTYRRQGVCEGGIAMNLEDVMESWGVADVDPDDIGAYVAARNEKRRVRDARKAFAPVAKKLYGYHEPTSVKPLRPRMAAPIHDTGGGWDSTTGTGVIPKYNWHDDPLRKKKPPPPSSPRGACRPVAALGPIRREPFKGVLCSAEAKSADSVPQPLFPVRHNTLPPISIKDAVDRRNHGNRKSIGSAPGALDTSRSQQREDNIQGLRPHGASQGILRRPNLKAYSAPSTSWRSAKLPAMMPSSALGRSPSSSRTATPRRPPPASTNVHLDTSPRCSQAGCELDLSPLQPQRKSDLENMAQLQRTLLSEMESKSDMEKRREALWQRLEVIQTELRRLKGDIKLQEGSQRQLVAIEKERSTLRASQRRIEMQLHDFRRMLSQASARLAEERSPKCRDDVYPTSATKLNDANERADKSSLQQLRLSSKNREAMRARVAQLKEEHARLLDEAANIRAAATDHQQRQALAREKAAREYSASVDDIKVKLQAEIDAEVLRLRQNHAKAIRHREREVEMHSHSRSSETEEETKKLLSTLSTAESLTRTLAEARGAVAAQQTILDERSAQLSAKRSVLESLKDRLRAKQRALDELHDAIESASRQLEVAQNNSTARQELSEALKAERHRLHETLKQHQAREAALRGELQQSETNLQAARQRQQLEESKAKQSLNEADAQLAAVKAEKNAAAVRLGDARKTSAAIAAMDAEIESLTVKLAEARSTQRAAHHKNTDLLDRLDRGERLLSLSIGDAK